MRDREQKRANFSPLQISDLLVLILTVSVSLACIAPHLHDRLNSPDSVSGNPKWHDVAREVSDHTAVGIVLFGLFVLGREKVRGSLGAPSPGQWYLLATGPASDLIFLIATVRPAIAASPGDFAPASDVLLVVVIVFSWIVSSWAIVVTDWQWKICLSFVLLSLLLMAGFFIWGIGRSLQWWQGVPAFRALIATATTAHILVCAAAFCAVIIDTYNRRARDWLHFAALVPLTLNAFSHTLSFGSMTWKWWINLYYYLLP